MQIKISSLVLSLFIILFTPKLALANHYGSDFVFSGADCSNENVTIDCNSTHQWCYDKACHVAICPYSATNGENSCNSNSECASGWCNGNCCSAPPVAPATPIPVSTTIPTSTPTPLSPTEQPTTIPTSQPTQSPVSPTVPSIIVTKIQINGQDLDLNGTLNLTLPEIIKTQDVQNKIDVTYSDNSTKSFYLAFHYQPKTTPVTSESNEFLVDVIIRQDVHNQEEVKQWITDTINNEINVKYQQSRLKPRFKLGDIYIFDGITCPLGTFEKKKPPVPGVFFPGTTCESNKDGKIRLWIQHGVDPADLNTATAYILPVWLYPTSGYGTTKDDAAGQVIHEISHFFTPPDYYQENVSPENNLVVPIGITAYAKDWMWDHYDPRYKFFSETSKGFIDRSPKIPTGATDSQGVAWADKYTPKDIVLRVTDYVVSPDHNIPEPDVKVEVFSEIGVGSGSSNGKISNKASNSGFTNDKGEFDLGDVFKLFDRSETDVLRWYGLSAFLRLTKNNQVRYASITRSYLNSLYFLGQQDKTTIILRFSALTVYEPGKIKVLSAGRAESVPQLSEKDKKFREQDQAISPHTLPPIPQPTPTPEPLKLIDFNNDGVINIFDRIIYVQKKVGL